MSTSSTGINTTIHPSVTFEVPDARKPAEYFSRGLPHDEYLYGRFGHPNYHDLSCRLKSMEGVTLAQTLLFASGMAATFALFFARLSVGDHIVVSSRIYGGTRGQIAMLAHKLHLEVSVVDITDIVAVRAVCRKETKLLFAEMVSNPDMVVADIVALRGICHGNGGNILLVVDNTFTPLIAQPLLCGADVVMHSLTKYVNGRSDAMGGALIGAPWEIGPLAHPATGEASLIGAVLHHHVAQEMAERFAEIRGRVRESSQRAHELAKLFLRAGLDVRYPLLHASPCNGQLARMGEVLGGGVFSVAFGSEEEGVRFVDHVRDVVVHDPLHGEVRLAIPAVSLGSAHTYAWCTTEARAQGNVTKWPALPFAPVPFGFVRIAVGYLGDRFPVLSAFKRALQDLGYIVAPKEVVFHT